MLLVDSGNLLFKQVKATGERERLTAAAISEIYREMDYDAVAVGPLDLAAGSDFLTGEATLPWLSANLRDSQQQPLFASHKVVSRRGIDIGIIGLTGQEDGVPPGLVIADWRGLLPQLLAQMQGSCQLVVVLSTLPEADNRELIRRFPEVHVLLSGDRHRGNIAPMHENRTVLAQTAAQGKYLGILDISFDLATPLESQGSVVGRVPLGSGARQLFATFSGQSLPLGPKLSEDPAIAIKVKEANEKIRQRNP